MNRKAKLDLSESSHEWHQCTREFENTDTNLHQINTTQNSTKKKQNYLLENIQNHISNKASNSL